MATERHIFMAICVIAAMAFTVLFVQISSAQNDLEIQARILQVQTQILEGQVERNRKTIVQLRATDKVLCNRGFIIIDLVSAGILLIEQRLAADLATGDLVAIRADQKFLNMFAANHVKLTKELTRKGSPCATIR
jgi:hypothetical protein